MIKIGYFSFDASVKIHYSEKYTSTKTSKTGYGGIAGYIHHLDRSTDKMNGCEVQHSNENIDSNLTLENESYFRNENGEWQKTSYSSDMVNAINRRIEYAKEHGARISTKGKNDTAIVRPLVDQLDNDSISEQRNKSAYSRFIRALLPLRATGQPVQAQSQAVAIREMNVQKKETEVAEILELCNQIVSDEKN